MVLSTQTTIWVTDKGANMKRKFMVLALCIMLGLTGTLFGNRSVNASLSEQKQDVEENIAEFKKEIKKLEGQTFEILAKLNAVEASIVGAEAKISQLEQELSSKEAELQTATALFNQKKEEFYSHLRGKYEDGDIEYVSVILESANLTDVINYNEYYRIMKLREEAKMAELASFKAGLEKQKQDIAANKQSTIEQKNTMTIEREKLSAVKKTYDSTMGSLKKQLAAEQAERSEILRQLAELSSTYVYGNYTGNGRFQWPVPSIPTTTTNVQRFYSGHAGFDIGGYGVSGRGIVAAEEGIVVLAQSYYGYGNAVVIDHGSGMKTLYGHLATISVRPGQTVSRGTIIGVMGNTGQSTGIHLHFEVIINGVHVNPEPYIR